MADNNQKEKDSLSGVETTGHEWDGLKELNNPAPRWWLWVFLVTVVWSVWYWVVYPAWPTAEGGTAGSYKWTQYKQLASSQQEIITLRGEHAEKIRQSSLQEIAHDPALYEFARAGGAAAFKENCAVCHGTGAAGMKGYPNLNDDDWLWGGTLDEIYQTIRVGIRSNHEETHNTQMPSFGGVLSSREIGDVVEYIYNLHKGDKAEVGDSFVRGRQVYADNCAACHGDSGQGDQVQGAPRLNDEIWLYGDRKEDIHSSVSSAHAGVMPAWEGRLPDDTVKSLAVYVHSLGGGK